MKNIYDGVVTLDVYGEAEVQLPAWFEALNTDFRYQLTAIGASADLATHAAVPIWALAPADADVAWCA